MNAVLAVVGPTGIGKSEMGLYLAQNLDGEIINADSRQVYRYMDIGTAKPSQEDRALVPHHLYDILNPDEEFSLAVYQEMAYQTIADIQRRCRLPVLVGGSGLYVWAVLEGWCIPEVPADKKLRRELEEMAQHRGSDILYSELLRVDPESAKVIGHGNTRRVIRALEVFYVTGIPFSALRKKEAPDFQSIIVGLTEKREELYKKIDQRVDNMITRGLIEETKDLLQKGYNPDLPAMSGIGYKQIVEFLRGELDLTDAVWQIKKATRNFIRHQYAWFRLNDRRIHWFDITLTDKRAILEWVKGSIASSHHECLNEVGPRDRRFW
jgi:tRNA dimethylallyltransferase